MIWAQNLGFNMNTKGRVFMALVLKNKEQWVKYLETNRDLRRRFYDDGLHMMFINDAGITAITGNKVNQEALKHGVAVATRISCDYPLLRMAAIFHDLAIPPGCNYMHKRHAVKGAWIAEYWLTTNSNGWSKDDIQYIKAIISVHSYNFFNRKYRDGEQPLKQWRRALIDATKIYDCFYYKPLLRFALADAVDPRQNTYGRAIIRYHAGRQLINYFYNSMIVRSRYELCIDTVKDILYKYPWFKKEDLSGVYKHLLNVIVEEGYDANDHDNLVIEIERYMQKIATKHQEKDSRVHFFIV